MGMTGVEPALDGLKVRCIAALIHTLKSRTGVEPVSDDWKSPVLAIEPTRHIISQSVFSGTTF